MNADVNKSYYHLNLPANVLLKELIAMLLSSCWCTMLPGLIYNPLLLMCLSITCIIPEQSTPFQTSGHLQVQRESSATPPLRQWMAHSMDTNIKRLIVGHCSDRDLEPERLITGKLEMPHHSGLGTGRAWQISLSYTKSTLIAGLCRPLRPTPDFGWRFRWTDPLASWI